MSRRPETSNEDSYLIAGRPSNLLRTSFTSAQLEGLYRDSSLQQRRGGLQCFLISALFYGVQTMATPGQGLHARSLNAVFLGVNLGLLAWAEHNPRGKDALSWILVPHMAWYLSIAQLLAQLCLKTGEVTPRDGLGWLLLLLYLLYATLPLRLFFCALDAQSTVLTYILVVIVLPKGIAQIPIDVLVLTLTLTTGAMLLGVSSYLLTEFQQRRAFLETRQSLEVQLVIEEQSAEQERLLLSVLPEHVAVKMRQDLGASLDTQFKKIYMSRHENVSILYADIVGFTAISSTYSASELVKILNELFARFDQLSERYEQLRIKILGDCYYCISGAPVERPDHAVLSVYMGLSMVDAIKYVQQTTNSPVDMRVGIHTGAVLAGVLGQRQWQFDVYSKDVELANKMESSGMAGRVHISNATLSFLNGEFEVEPAHGEDREEALQKAGIVTYFIVRALKPFKPAVTKSLASLTDAETTKRTMENVRDGRNNKEDSEEFRQRLREELDSKGGVADLKGHAHWLTLRFKDTNVESAFHHAEEAFSPLSLIGGPLAMICAAPVWRFQPWGPFTWGGLGVVVLFGVVLAGATCLGSAVKAMWLRKALALLMTFSLGVFLLLDMSNCVVIAEPIPILNASVTPSPRCPYPSYYSYIGVLTLVAISMPTYICYLGKATLMYGIAGFQCFINIWLLGSRLDWEDHASSPLDPAAFPSKYSLSATLLIVATSLVIVTRERVERVRNDSIDFQTEKARRMLYLRGREVVAQRERAADMKRRNGALIYNILPPHVAAYFLTRARHYDDLYSQSYAEVGVLFASMPNFADFYSEESINNQGLECLRFLNEVISDFDAILDQNKFRDIIKIKTIGSTYMAASGITDSEETEDAPRWGHLSTLVEFALELKKALSSLNEQSFNHFVLKMGINHGPVTAGVIGARKPHYDIWGNTVNVASRMESTGKVGCIQVTDETRRILEPFGFGFEQRGLVFVKGKGQLLTHYLVSKDGVSLNLDSDLPVEPTHPIIYQ
ncbi:Adenylate cyclase type 3 [Dufourea novaeangliae]|uniref:Adenylate cyclase type 3 n=1 Tax=Dufourea novaeangliae TaxID=178035 RepID=A0A154PSI0_DUFNO|nr:Adenylate cyclase type 3 [Dufourea novaeangliae]